MLDFMYDFSLLEWFYDAWFWIEGFDVLIGIAAACISLVTSLKTENKYLKVGMGFLTMLIIFVILASLYVRGCYTKVPDVRGDSFSEAKNKLETAELEYALEPDTVIESNTDKYKVEKQSHEPGTLVSKKETIIMLYLSLEVPDGDANTPTPSVEPTATSTPKPSPEPTSTPEQEPTVTATPLQGEEVLIPVPDVRGMEIGEAREVLEEKGLSVQEWRSSKTDSSLGQYYVGSQSVPANSFVPKGSVIKIELSEKAPTVTPDQKMEKMVFVPDVVGMEEDEAIKEMEERGLEPHVCWSTGLDISLEPLYIGRQSLPANSVVPEGSEIELRLLAEKVGTPVIVPEVVGMTLSEASSILMNSGLEFSYWCKVDVDGEREKYYVIGQSMEGNMVVAAGTSITLEVSLEQP